MAHSALIDGTAYGIKGGKCLVDGTEYSIKRGIGLVEGTQVEYKFTVEPSLVINSKSDWDNFVQIADTFASGELVRLGTNISLSGDSYSSIDYAGDFDGGNFTLDDGYFDGGGIFKQIGPGQKICNLTVDAIYIKKSFIEGFNKISGILSPVALGEIGNEALIQNVHVTSGQINTDNNIGGGIVGRIGNYVQAIYCSCTGGSIYGTVYCGGIAGQFRGKINQSASTITPNTLPLGGVAGGIAGLADDGTITSCWCTFRTIVGQSSGVTTSKVLYNATVSDDFTPIELETGKWTVFSGQMPSLRKSACMYQW